MKSEVREEDESVTKALLDAKEAFFKSLTDSGNDGAYFGIRLEAKTFFMDSDIRVSSGKRFVVEDGFEEATCKTRNEVM